MSRNKYNNNRFYNKPTQKQKIESVVKNMQKRGKTPPQQLQTIVNRPVTHNTVIPAPTRTRPVEPRIMNQYKPINTSKLYGRDKVVNNQFKLEYQSIENLKEFVGKRGNFEKTGETYEEVLTQAFKIARGIRYKDENKFMNPNYRGKGDQQKVALRNELNVSEQKHSIKLSEKIKKNRLTDRLKVDEINISEGKRTKIAGENELSNLRRDKPIMDFAKDLVELSGVKPKRFDETYKPYESIPDELTPEKEKSALKKFRISGHLWGLEERTRIVQENMVREIAKGNSVTGIKGDPELAELVAQLDVREIYVLTLNKDISDLFISSDLVESLATVNDKLRIKSRENIVKTIREYIELKKTRETTAADFIKIIKAEPEGYLF